MSKLIVEVCCIEEVIKHPNADKLDIVKVKGWQCIVSTNSYKVGDLVVYCPPDSIIPPTLIEIYKLEFLKKNGRVDTIKLRKEISQGLILNVGSELGCYKLGDDVAEKLGITKYEPPEANYSLRGGQQQKKRKSNPLFDKYTDIENINNFNRVLEEGEEVIITEKIHGSNARYAHLPVNTNVLWGWILKLCGKDYEFVYGSHEIQKKFTNIHKGFYKEDVWGIIAKRYRFSEWLPKDVIIYGEIYGKGIQELTYNLEDIDIRIFDVKYKGKYLDWQEYLDFINECNTLLILTELSCLQLVPVLFRGKYNDDTRKLLSTGVSTMPGATNIREGCVIKPIKEREHHSLGRVILKSLNPEYLLLKDRTEFH